MYCAHICEHMNCAKTSFPRFYNSKQNFVGKTVLMFQIFFITLPYRLLCEKSHYKLLSIVAPVLHLKIENLSKRCFCQHGRQIAEGGLD